MRGRGSRLASWIGKQCFWMFDYVGVTEGDDGEGGEGGFVTIKPPKATWQITQVAHRRCG